MSEDFISELDTLRFGFTIAKVNSFEKSPKSVINMLKDKGVKLILSKINIDNLGLINELENLGFRIKDSQVTYSFDLGKTEFDHKKHFGNNVEVREFRMQDLDYIIPIIEESFNGYGHYFADERLDKKKCLDIYKDWGKRSCTDKSVADIVFVATHEGKTIGLLSFKRFGLNDRLYAAGGLGAVVKNYRGMNVFKNLIISGLQWGLENNLDWEEHNVLTTNYAVNSSFSSVGFKIKNSFVTMHGWL